MDLKNEKFLKTVGLCAAGLAGTFVFPTITALTLGATAAYLYSNAPKTKENFFKMGGAMLAAAFVGTGPIGLLALAGYGALVHPLMKQKGQRFYGKPYHEELATKAKKMFSSKH